MFDSPTSIDEWHTHREPTGILTSADDRMSPSWRSYPVSSETLGMPQLQTSAEKAFFNAHYTFLAQGETLAAGDASLDRPRRNAISLHAQAPVDSFNSFHWDQAQPFQQSLSSAFNFKCDESVDPKDVSISAKGMASPSILRPDIYQGLIASLNVPTISSPSTERSSFSTSSGASTVGSYWSPSCQGDLRRTSENMDVTGTSPLALDDNALGLYASNLVPVAPIAEAPEPSPEYEAPGETNSQQERLPWTTLSSNDGHYTFALPINTASFTGPQRRTRSCVSSQQKSPRLRKMSLCDLEVQAQQQAPEQYSSASRPALVKRISRTTDLPLLSTVASYTDASPQTLKSPSKVLAYQARVRQQRGALRDVIDELKMYLTALVERRAETSAVWGSRTYDTVSSLLFDSSNADDELQRAFSASPPRTSFFIESATSPGIQSIEEFSPPKTSFRNLSQAQPAESHSSFVESFGSRTGRQESPASSAKRTPSPGMAGTVVVTDVEQIRRRQKNGYKQRLRAEELAGIQFILSIARVISSLLTERNDAMLGDASFLNTFDDEVLETTRQILWRHQPDWDLLLAAEKRMVTGGTVNASPVSSAKPLKETAAAAADASPRLTDATSTEGESSLLYIVLASIASQRC